MRLFSQVSSAARTALIYITIGSLMVIWTSMWYVYLYNNRPETHAAYYVSTGLLISGLVLMGIGFGVGRIGRSTMHAGLPVEVASPTAALVSPQNVLPTAVVGSADLATPVVVADS